MAAVVEPIMAQPELAAKAETALQKEAESTRKFLLSYTKDDARSKERAAPV